MAFWRYEISRQPFWRTRSAPQSPASIARGDENVAAVDDGDRVAFLASLLERKYALYDWTETKIASLIALDGLLLAAAFVLLDSRGGKRLPTFRGDLSETTVSPALMLLSVMPLLVSLLICLWHITPTMNSRSTAKPELPRALGSVQGLALHGSRDAFRSKVARLTSEDIIWSQTAQIWGMNVNILKNTRAVRAAVWCSTLGTLALTATFLFV